jgi:GST-like protein
LSCPVYQPFRSPRAGRQNIPIACSFIRCRRRTASRCRSCWRRSGCPTRCIWSIFGKDDQKTPEFLSLNPNGKIPAILDPNGPGAAPLGLFESGAILQYLAEKTGSVLPSDAARRWQTIQWVHFQMGGIGPMFGQVGFFHKFAGKEFADKRPLERYVAESKRLLGVLEARLAGRQWIMDDDYTIADIASLGWVRNLIGFYGARELVGFDDFANVSGWLDRGLARPAVQRGLEIPKRP